MTPTFRRFCGVAALGAGIAGVVYSVTFVVVVQRGSEWAKWTSSIALLAGALLIIPTVCGAYFTFADREPEFALMGLLIGIGGALGSASHAAWDLAVYANPPAISPDDAPFPADPRGFATFALVGTAVALFGWLGYRTDRLPTAAVVWAEVTALALVIIFIGRLTVLDPKSGLLRPLTALTGFVLNPVVLFGLGRHLLLGLAVREDAGDVRLAPA
jgi:hypothetical protein